MKRFRIIVDCDDVLYQCNQFALDILNKKEETDFVLEDITRWGLLHSTLDKRLDYFHDAEFVAEIPLYDGAKEFISALSKKAEVFIATSVPADCAGARVSSIIRNFPEIDPGNILIGNRKDMLTADMMLDDCPEHIKKSCVSYPVLFRQPWNTDVSGVISVSDYGELLTLIDLITDTKPLQTDGPVVLVGPSGSGKHKIVDELVSSGEYEYVKGYSTIKGNVHTHVNRKKFLISKKCNIFFETSSYAGELYGICMHEICEVFQNHRIPVLVLDINGAIAIKKKYNGISCFVTAEKEDCIRNILNKSLNAENKIKRIASIDGELANENLCDISIQCAADILNVRRTGYGL